MARTTPDLVRTIADADDGVDLMPFIQAANELVTEVCAAPGVYSSGRLQMIESWLAAHFYHILDPQASQETVEGIQVTLDTRVDLGLAVTKYGQQAMRLDTGGYLAALDNAMKTVTKTLPGGGKKVGVTWLGTDLCD